MIELKVADFCHNCPEFEPDVDKNILYYDSFFGESKMNVITKVTCVHEQRCHSIVNFIEARRKEKSNGQ